MKRRCAWQALSMAPFLVGLFAAPAHALERLFTTPAERAAIDAARAAYRPAEEPVVRGAAPDAMPGAAVQTEQTQINGVVLRGAGRDAVWLNGRSTPAASLARHGGAAGVILRSQGKAVTLKPGQVLDTATGRVYEAYEIRSAPAGVGQTAAPPPSGDAGPQEE